MHSGKIVEKYLDKIAAGEVEYLGEFLTVLSDQILYTPVVQFRHTGEKKGINRINVATFLSDERRIVPTFTSEEYFLEWSQGKHQCFSVAGGDLALTLPQETWIVVNPSQSNSIKLSPSQIEILAYGQLLSDEADDEYTRTKVSTKILKKDSRFTSSEDPATGSQARASACQTLSCEAFSKELYLVIEQYEEVQEAYFEETQEGPAFGVLGVLSESLSAARRFTLVDRIAELSRKHFGAAGAVEVYDDLHVTTSRSWDLFNTLTPFYVRGDRAEVGGGTSLKIEKSVIGSGEQGSEFGSAKSAWQGVRETGSRLFGVLKQRGK